MIRSCLPTYPTPNGLAVLHAALCAIAGGWLGGHCVCEYVQHQAGAEGVAKRVSHRSRWSRDLPRVPLSSSMTGSSVFHAASCPMGDMAGANGLAGQTRPSPTPTLHLTHRCMEGGRSCLPSSNLLCMCLSVRQVRSAAAGPACAGRLSRAIPVGPTSSRRDVWPRIAGRNRAPARGWHRTSRVCLVRAPSSPSRIQFVFQRVDG